MSLEVSRYAHARVASHVAGTAMQRSVARATEKSTDLPRGMMRKCACGKHTPAGSTCQACQDGQARLQRRAAVNHDVPTPVPSIVHEVLRSSGQALDAETRAFFEPRFGHNFSSVRVHVDARAAQSARAVQALAYTVGSNIVFGANQFAPGSRDGRGLLGHELAHTLQQRQSSGGLSLNCGERSLEEGAEVAGRELADGRAVSGRFSTGALRVSRQPDAAAERAKAVAEANTALAEMDAEDKADDAASDPPATAKKKPSQFSPGGFSDEDAQKLLNDAQSRMVFLEKAMDLAEKQARRSQFFEKHGNLSGTRLKRALGDAEFRKEMAELDISWDPKTEDFIRNAYVDKLEAPINADKEAKRTYDDYLWGMTHNQPEEESRFHAAVGFICRHTNPCASNMEQFHHDMESGMSRDEALNRGMARVAVFAETAALPGGPSGPIAVGPVEPPAGPVEMSPSEPVESGDLSSTKKASQPPPPPPGRPPAETLKASPPPPPVNTSASRPTATPVAGKAPASVSEAEVVAAYERDPSTISTHSSSRYHQQVWRENGGGSARPPMAYRIGDRIVVDVEQWLSTSRPYIGTKLRPGASAPPWKSGPGAQPDAVTPPAKRPPDPGVGTADTGKAPVPEKPKGGVQTGAASDESKQPMAPAQRRGGRMMPKDPPQAASPEVVARLGSRARYSVDHDHHQQAWELLGGRGTAPPAFYSEGNAYLDPSRWPPTMK
jgi:hypothetical protein